MNQDVEGREEVGQSNQHLPDHRACRARVPPEEEMDNSCKQQQPRHNDAHRDAGNEGQGNSGEASQDEKNRNHDSHAA